MSDEEKINEALNTLKMIAITSASSRLRMAIDNLSDAVRTCLLAAKATGLLDGEDYDNNEDRIMALKFFAAMRDSWESVPRARPAQMMIACMATLTVMVQASEAPTESIMQKFNDKNEVENLINNITDGDEDG